MYQTVCTICWENISQRSQHSRSLTPMGMYMFKVLFILIIRLFTLCLRYTLHALLLVNFLLLSVLLFSFKQFYCIYFVFPTSYFLQISEIFYNFYIIYHNRFRYSSSVSSQVDHQNSFYTVHIQYYKIIPVLLGQKIYHTKLENQ